MPDPLPFARPGQAVGSKGAYPVEQFRGSRRLLESLFPEEIKLRKTCFEELSLDAGEMQPHNGRSVFGPGNGM